MKKLLVLTLAMLFIGVGIAGASTLKMSGNYYVKGTWYDNMAGTATQEPKESFGQYDHEMTLDMVFQMTPYTKVATRIELRDEIWGVANSANGGASEGNAATTNQNNIYVEELYGQHTFMNHNTIVVGLVKTSTWSTDFDNNSDEAFRLNWIFQTPIGPGFIYTEKYETDSALTGETLGTDADTDAYVAALYTKIGSVNVLPLFAYIDAENSAPLATFPTAAGADFQLLKFDLGLTGTINNISFEAELIYADYNYDIETTAAISGDYTAYGLYAKVWTQIDALTIGAYAAYGSYDKDVNKGFSFGDDFDGNDELAHDKLMLLGDEVDFGVSAATVIDSATVGVVYGTYNVNEKASVSLLFGYADSNVDTVGNAMDGATAWELNCIGQYKITPLVTYTVGAATAQLDYGNAVDPDAAVEFSHMLSFNF